jgi:hypothetical protein
MTDKSIIELLCSAPANFYGGTKSILALISESGIISRPDMLEVDKIAKYLSLHPALINGWLRWSESKRVRSGWYLIRSAKGYSVGFYPEGEELQFDQVDRACAEFIVREVESIISGHPQRFK